MNRVVLNARFRNRPVTGVERFAIEVSRRLGDLEEIRPENPIAGLKGHAWEQLILSRKIGRDSVLLSPCNTGPITVKRQLVVIHDAAVWDCPEGFSGAFRHVYQQLLPRLARSCQGVATVSEFSRQRLAGFLGIPEERILVLGNAVSDAFSPGKGPADGDDATLLCVGSLDPRKNLSRLIRVWLELKAQGRLPEKARLKLIGGANPRNFADFERAEDVSIQWLGRVSDDELIREYRQAAAFIYPSYYEGFGLPPLEAMACGCPVLLSHQASLPEVGGMAFDPTQADSQGAVLYFDPFSEAEIGDTILRFLSLDATQRSALRANAIVRSHAFSWDAIAESTAGALARI
ncbi:MAG: glycosyltransferase family 4 protein [Verrucomicrobiae bacterium]|nr:glycosyltransferase family 4 protein [Verrucomicrobiae bacterium]